MKKSKYLLACVAMAVLFLASCEKKPTPEPLPRIDPDAKTFLMYDNIGSPWFEADVAEAGRAVAEGVLAKGHRVLVFHREYAQTTGYDYCNVIYELVCAPRENGGYLRRVLKNYGEEMSSFDVETVAAVVGDMRTLAPANHYGLAFGSHGRGWIPKANDTGIGRRAPGGYHTPEDGSAPEGGDAMTTGSEGGFDPDMFAPLWQIPDSPATRSGSAETSFGNPDTPATRYLSSDKNETMDVAEFADALDEWEWDFIIFDDCFMASVEAQYEIRHLADYFIASPTEIMIEGFPYDRVVRNLFKVEPGDVEPNVVSGVGWGDLSALVADYVNYYKNHPLNPYGTLSLVRTDRLESLARSVRAIMESPEWAGMTNPATASTVEGDDVGVQFYDGLRTHVFYDLGDFVRKGGVDTESALYRDFEAALSDAVVYAGHTEFFYSNMYTNTSGVYIPVDWFSGLSTFIPWSGTAPLMPFYEETAWYRDAYPTE
ncbi:MAG: hypothetical protein LBV18_04460 [Alistipes sp.]|jgi:hypothetical protein|nr:hypothetical protein [Alistipes sp.]